MARYLLIIIILIFSGSECLISQPKAVIGGGPFIDAGELPAGKTKSFNLGISNKGDKPLQIKDIKPDLPYISIDNYNKLINPGQSGSLKFTVTVCSGCDRFISGLTIITNENKNNRHIIQVAGTVKSPVEVIPVNYRNIMKAGSPNEVKLIIKNNTDKAIYINKLELCDNIYPVNFKDNTAVGPGDSRGFDFIVIPPDSTVDFNCGLKFMSGDLKKGYVSFDFQPRILRTEAP